MGSEEFAQKVRGSSSQAIATSEAGSIQTNNFVKGDGINEDGSGYPYTFDPAYDIEFIHITKSGDIELEITTTTDNVLTIPLAGGTGVIDWISCKSITFKDPDATGAELNGSYAGGT